jgi:salicylate hydroxylase
VNVKSRRTILINGGGIAGLTTALCLAAAGFRVDLFERAPGFDATGAGLQISPNALHVLDRLGLTKSIKNIATGPSAIRIMSGTSGRQIVDIPLGASAIRRYGLPYLVAHRADLQQVLSRAVYDNPDITLHLNSQIVEMAEHANGVTALVYSRGQINEYHGIALIAADGVWSSLRTRLFELAPARYSGSIAWRALIAAEQLPGVRDLENTQLWLASKAHAVTYPVRGGRYLNVVIVTNQAERQNTIDVNWTCGATADEVKTELKGWHPDFLSLFAYRARWTCWPLFHMPKTRNLVKGRAALVGDAAHAMLPYAAQGAAMAIEDAATLAHCLINMDKSKTGVHDALLAYQKARIPRINRAARLTSANRSIYHLSQPLALARNMAMIALGGQRLLRRNDWLYHWRADQLEHIPEKLLDLSDKNMRRNKEIERFE